MRESVVRSWAPPWILLAACGSPPQAVHADRSSETHEAASKKAGVPNNDAGCSSDQWCIVRGVPSAVTLSAVWAASANDVWAVGEGGVALHWDGSQWTEVPSGTKSALRVLTGTSSEDIWAAGLDGVLLHYDGRSWSATQPNAAPWSPVTGTNVVPIYALFADAPRQVWVGGSGLHHFDGKAWSAPFHASHLPIMALWGTDAKRAWGAGLAGTLLRWDGEAWSRAAHDEGPHLYGVWGSAQNDVWIVGSAGTIQHFDGTEWVSAPSGSSKDLHAVHGSGPRDVWAVGDGGTLLHWRGAGWEPSSSPSPAAFLGVWAASERDVWAVGENGVVLHRTSTDTAP